jgi:hypothetical protein
MCILHYARPGVHFISLAPQTMWPHHDDEPSHRPPNGIKENCREKHHGNNDISYLKRISEAKYMTSEKNEGRCGVEPPLHKSQ